jgi:hypothetical protein
MESLVSGSTILSVAFPDTEECITTDKYVSIQCADIIASSPTGAASAALETYATWLADYLASGLV